MVEVREPQMEFEEGPARITVDNVQFWCKHGRELKHTQRHKALQFVENDCIRYIGDDKEYESKYTFICLPLNTDDHSEDKDTGQVFNKKPFGADYNDTIYKIYKQDNGRFICNCQGWSSSERHAPRDDGCQCSHVLALFYCFKIGIFRRDKHGINKQVTVEEDEDDEI